MTTKAGGCAASEPSLLAGAGFGFTLAVWLGLVLLAAGVLVAFEELRG